MIHQWLSFIWNQFIWAQFLFLDFIFLKKDNQLLLFKNILSIILSQNHEAWKWRVILIKNMFSFYD